MYKLLGQAAPEDTAAATIITWPRSDRALTIRSIIVCNVTSSAATCRIFHPASTTATYSVATALFYDVSVQANGSTVIELNIELSSDAPYLGVQSGTASALMFSVYGG